MKIKSVSCFTIKGLNQERVLQDLAKEITLFKINRIDTRTTTFCCSYTKHKKVQKILRGKNLEIMSVEHHGFLPTLTKLSKQYGVIAAIVVAVLFYVVQSPFVWQYQVNGTCKLSQSEVVRFVKKNYSQNKNKIDTKEVEIALLDKFEQISFASCIIKGQTLVINIKEKLLPDEIYGQFRPIISQKNGKITEIELISGTAVVKVGDYVKKGDVLVEPYTIDTDGKKMQIQADAHITAEVYNTAQVTHFEKFLETYKTGRQVVQTEVKLFGLGIYAYKPEMTFAMFEKVEKQTELSKNNILPLKKVKTTYYELAQREVVSTFEDVKDVYLQKSREKALENCLQHDKIKEEYYTLKQLSGATIINYCIVSVEKIGASNES